MSELSKALEQMGENYKREQVELMRLRARVAALEKAGDEMADAINDDYFTIESESRKPHVILRWLAAKKGSQ